jgi:hypothetical protein
MPDPRLTAIMAAMQHQGGGGNVPPSPAASTSDAFRAPQGIPDPRLALPAPTDANAPDVLADLRAGKVGAAQILQLVAMLAGLSQAPQPQGPPSEVADAFGG